MNSESPGSRDGLSQVLERMVSDAEFRRLLCKDAATVLGADLRLSREEEAMLSSIWEAGAKVVEASFSDDHVLRCCVGY
jgi:hypothetical protein